MMNWRRGVVATGVDMVSDLICPLCDTLVHPCSYDAHVRKCPGNWGTADRRKVAQCRGVLYDALWQLEDIQKQQQTDDRACLIREIREVLDQTSE